MSTRREFLGAAAGSALTLTLPGSARSARASTLQGEHVEQILPAHAVTQGPKAHFFGYYDKCPWDASGRYLLAKQIDYCDRQPEPGETLTVGMIDLQDNNKYLPLDETAAWSWQQGTMLQWLGSAPDREIIYNSIDDDQYVAIIRDIHSGRTRKLPRPIYAASLDGTKAVTLDYDRLNRLRPGYGYHTLPEAHPDDPAPDSAGIYAMDISSGENDLIISIAQLAKHKADERFQEGAHHWVNHLQFNPSGDHFLFLHRWQQEPGQSRWYTRMYTARPDGSDLRLIQDTGMVSHFDWRDDRTILAWSVTEENGNAFYLFDIESGEITPMGQDVLPRDGHCSYSPDRQWVLNDTYPDSNRLQTLMLYHPGENKRIDIGRFFLPPKLTGPFRCDLHPRWNRDGTQVCIDSAHEADTRQLYVIDVSSITQA
ncbi:hypothetical protein BH23PLA1_BH23PLA1_42750 [soil metagenome]